MYAPEFWPNSLAKDNTCSCFLNCFEVICKIKARGHGTVTRYFEEIPFRVLVDNMAEQTANKERHDVFQKVWAALTTSIIRWNEPCACELTNRSLNHFASRLANWLSRSPTQPTPLVSS